MTIITLYGRAGTIGGKAKASGVPGRPGGDEEPVPPCFSARKARRVPSQSVGMRAVGKRSLGASVACLDGLTERTISL